jgi:hypothetical protein
LQGRGGRRIVVVMSVCDAGSQCTGDSRTRTDQRTEEGS